MLGENFLPFVEKLLPVDHLVLFETLVQVLTGGRAFVVDDLAARLVKNFVTGPAQRKAEIRVLVVSGRVT